jgi:hypothetical protein
MDSTSPEVPQWAKGVGCYFCHNVIDVQGTHNNPLLLAMDQTLRGGFRDPVRNAAHRSAYSPLVDADSPQSSKMCGACHDIVTPRGVHLERTFAEWQSTIFAQDNPQRHLSCGECHMISNTDVIAEDPAVSVKLRPSGRREHTFAGVDVALTAWPDKALQQAAIDRDLAALLVPRLCVLPVDGGRIDYRLDNVGAGHMFPSGATADRRVWIELVAYGAGDAVLFSTGLVPAADPPLDPEDLGDPNLWRLDTPATDAAGARTEKFWAIQAIDHPGTLLGPAVTTDPNDPRFYHAVEKSFPVPGLVPQIERAPRGVLIRPLPMALLGELFASGHLAGRPARSGADPRGRRRDARVAHRRPRLRAVTGGQPVMQNVNVT